ncbi:hypothetical protein F7U66_01220 [Vibrio parahaemolyticus]|nr:hypothetical protein [Vibrio parahaemolyticus]
MKLSVPFIYLAYITRGAVTTPVLIKDSTEVEIKESTHEEMPVAFRMHNEDFLFDGENVFYLDYYRLSEHQHLTATLDEVVKYTTNPKSYPYSQWSSKAPFLKFWQHCTTALEHWDNPTEGNALLKDSELDNTEVIRANELSYDKWESDNRDEIIELANVLASTIVSVEGTMYRKTAEPRYQICLFGPGNNNGSTKVYVSQSYNPHAAIDSYFNANELDKCLETARELAEFRGDTDSLPMKVFNDCVVEVYIPEAVKLKPNTLLVEEGYS